MNRSKYKTKSETRLSIEIKNPVDQYLRVYDRLMNHINEDQDESQLISFRFFSFFFPSTKRSIRVYYFFCLYENDHIFIVKFHIDVQQVISLLLILFSFDE